MKTQEVKKEDFERKSERKSSHKIEPSSKINIPFQSLEKNRNERNKSAAGKKKFLNLVTSSIISFKSKK